MKTLHTGDLVDLDETHIIVFKILEEILEGVIGPSAEPPPTFLTEPSSIGQESPTKPLVEPGTAQIKYRQEGALESGGQQQSPPLLLKEEAEAMRALKQNRIEDTLRIVKRCLVQKMFTPTLFWIRGEAHRRQGAFFF